MPNVPFWPDPCFRCICVQGQVGCGFEQPDQVEGVPAQDRGLERDGLQGPFKPKPL